MVSAPWSSAFCTTAQPAARAGTTSIAARLSGVVPRRDHADDALRAVAHAGRRRQRDAGPSATAAQHLPRRQGVVPRHGCCLVDLLEPWPRVLPPLELHEVEQQLARSISRSCARRSTATALGEPGARPRELREPGPGDGIAHVVGARTGSSWRVSPVEGVGTPIVSGPRRDDVVGEAREQFGVAVEACMSHSLGQLTHFAVG